MNETIVNIYISESLNNLYNQYILNSFWNETYLWYDTHQLILFWLLLKCVSWRENTILCLKCKLFNRKFSFFNCCIKYIYHAQPCDFLQYSEQWRLCDITCLIFLKESNVRNMSDFQRAYHNFKCF